MITAEPSAHARPRNRKPLYIVAGLASAAVVTVGALAATGTFSGPGTFTVRGIVDNSNMDPGNPYSIVLAKKGTRCTDSETVTVQATVSGRAVTLGSGHTVRGYSVSNQECISSFTIRNVPSGYGAYGFQIQGVPGTVNKTTAQIAKGIGINISSGG